MLRLAITVGILAIIAICVLLAIGYIVKTRKLRPSISHVEKSVPTMFDLQTSMVEKAGSRWDVELLPKKEKKKVLRLSGTFAKQIEMSMLHCASDMRTECYFDILPPNSRSKRKRCTLHKDGTFCVKPEYAALVAERVHRLFKEKGYDVTYEQDRDCCKDSYIRLTVSWGEGLRKESLEKVQYKAQVDSFKKGVPLDDIV